MLAGGVALAGAIAWYTRRLSISQGTAARHVENILNKFGVSNRVEAIMKAVETSLIGPLRNSQGASPATGDADDALSDTGS